MFLPWLSLILVRKKEKVKWGKVMSVESYKRALTELVDGQRRLTAELKKLQRVNETLENQAVTFKQTIEVLKTRVSQFAQFLRSTPELLAVYKTIEFAKMASEGDLGLFEAPKIAVELFEFYKTLVAAQNARRQSATTNALFASVNTDSLAPAEVLSLSINAERRQSRQLKKGPPSDGGVSSPTVAPQINNELASSGANMPERFTLASSQSFYDSATPKANREDSVVMSVERCDAECQTDSNAQNQSQDADDDGTKANESEVGEEATSSTLPEELGQVVDEEVKKQDDAAKCSSVVQLRSHREKELEHELQSSRDQLQKSHEREVVLQKHVQRLIAQTQVLQEQGALASAQQQKLQNEVKSLSTKGGANSSCNDGLLPQLPQAGSSRQGGRRPAPVRMPMFPGVSNDAHKADNKAQCSGGAVFPQLPIPPPSRARRLLRSQERVDGDAAVQLKESQREDADFSSGLLLTYFVEDVCNLLKDVRTTLSDMEAAHWRIAVNSLKTVLSPKRHHNNGTLSGGEPVAAATAAPPQGAETSSSPSSSSPSEKAHPTITSGIGGDYGNLVRIAELLEYNLKDRPKPRFFAWIGDGIPQGSMRGNPTASSSKALEGPAKLLELCWTTLVQLFDSQLRHAQTMLLAREPNVLSMMKQSLYFASYINGVSSGKFQSVMLLPTSVKE